MNRIVRLYCDQNLTVDKIVILNAAQHHHLSHVLRIKNGSEIYIFDGKGKEYKASWQLIKKQKSEAHIIEQVKYMSSQNNLDIIFCFAPIKKQRLEYMMQKVTELDVREILPVITQYTQDSKIYKDKLEQNIIEAAQQSGRVYLPKLLQVCSFKELLKNWDQTRGLLFCDESLAGCKTQDKLLKFKQDYSKYAILIGPEGGFSESERQELKAQKYVQAISLGQNILRADTAAVVALSLLQLV